MEAAVTVIDVSMLAADVQDAVFLVENSQQSGEDMIYFTIHNSKSFKRVAKIKKMLIS